MKCMVIPRHLKGRVTAAKKAMADSKVSLDCSEYMPEDGPMLSDTRPMTRWRRHAHAVHG